MNTKGKEGDVERVVEGDSYLMEGLRVPVADWAWRSLYTLTMPGAATTGSLICLWYCLLP